MFFFFVLLNKTHPWGVLYNPSLNPFALHCRAPSAFQYAPLQPSALSLWLLCWWGAPLFQLPPMSSPAPGMDPGASVPQSSAPSITPALWHHPTGQGSTLTRCLLPY